MSRRSSNGGASASASVPLTISLDKVAELRKAYAASAKNTVAQNALSRTDMLEVLVSRATVQSTNHLYSHGIDKEQKATSQKSSGRCWIFAALNAMRVSFIKEHKLDGFEFSQAYVMFWDKLEKANWFLEQVIATAHEPTSDRTVHWLFQGENIASDGGQWQMFVNLVDKYGLVPKSVYPESYVATHTRRMNWLLKHKLREAGVAIRAQAAKDRKNVKALRELQSAAMSWVWRLLCICLGVPPERFDWIYKASGSGASSSSSPTAAATAGPASPTGREGRRKTMRAVRNLTPLAFVRDYVSYALHDKVCLIHAPTSDKPMLRAFTVKHLGNVVAGPPIRYINVPIDAMRDAIVASVCANEPVWFGCDVGKFMHRKTGIMDPTRLYDYDAFFDVGRFTMTKAERLDHCDSLMTHAMVFTAVDLPDGKPASLTKLRVENSWGTGEENGDNGYLLMTRDWFNEFVYEAVVDKKFLSPEILEQLTTDLIVLPPWDPMGALACASCSEPDPDV